MKVQQRNPFSGDIAHSPIALVSEYVKEQGPKFKKDTGKDFVTFQRGEINLDTPDYVKDAIKEGLDKNLTKYPKPGGELWLKEAILSYLEEKGVYNLDRENILVTSGGQQGLQVSFLLNGGSSVLGNGPIWPSMKYNILPSSSCGFMLSPFKEIDEKLEVDFKHLKGHLCGNGGDNIHTNNVDIFYLNNPNNPTGKVFSRSELSRINDLCKERDILIVSDESYNEILYGGNSHISMQEEGFENENIISSFTFSKTLSFTGGRIGFVLSRNKDLVNRLTKLQHTQTAGVPPFIQYGMKVALENGEKRNEYIAGMMEEFGQRRDIVYNGLVDVLEGNITKPESTFYYFLNLDEFIPSEVHDVDDYISSNALKRGIALVPGIAFSRGDEYKRSARISYSSMSQESLREGVSRLSDLFLDMKSK